MFHGLAGHDRRIALRQRVGQLGKRRYELNLYRAVVDGPQAGNFLVVVGAVLLPVIETDDPPLPQPGPLGAGGRIEMTFE